MVQPPRLQVLEGPTASFPKCLTREWKRAGQEGLWRGAGGSDRSGNWEEVLASPAAGGLDFRGMEEDHM